MYWNTRKRLLELRVPFFFQYKNHLPPAIKFSKNPGCLLFPSCLTAGFGHATEFLVLRYEQELSPFLYHLLTRTSLALTSPLSLFLWAGMRDR